MARKTAERQRGKKKRGDKVNEQQKRRPQAYKPKEERKVADEPAFVVDRVGDRRSEEVTDVEAPSAAPSWLVDQEEKPSETSAPFGLVEPDLKGYLRDAHTKLQESVALATEEGRALQEDDDVRALRNAMLDEIKGKELVLATDGDASVILEDMLSTFGERQVRILTSALMQEAYTVVCHRFGSHVVQSLLAALQYFVSRQKDVHADDEGGSTAEQLVLNLSEDMQAYALDIVRSSFSSHVLRTLLSVLAGRSVSTDGVRSKRSKHFHRNHAPLVAQTPWSTAYAIRAAPSFASALTSLLTSIKMAILDTSEVRSLCVDPIASPTFALLIELDDGRDLLDACLDGLASGEATERSSHVETLLRDSVGSHLLEQVVRVADDGTLTRFYTTYVRGRLAKLGAHPTANFVIAAVLRRLGFVDFVEACDEVAEHGSMLITSRHLGTLIALLDRARELQEEKERREGAVDQATSRKPKTVWTSSEVESRAVRALLIAFGIESSMAHEEEEKAQDGSLARLLLSGKTTTERRKAEKAAKKIEKDRKRKRKAAATEEDEADVKDEEEQATLVSIVTLQGSLLCQAMVRLGEPASTPLLDSILQLVDLRPIANDASGVHVLLAAIQSTRLSFAHRGKLCTAVAAQLPELATDKFGSRLVDSVYDTADLFFKQRMARACLDAERALLASTYGRFFLKRVHLALFRRDVAAWKVHAREAQQQQKRREQEEEAARAEVERAKTAALQAQAAAPPKRKKQKRSKEDEAFAAILAQV